ncbi:MAG: GNAT family N-acetyltransferase [Haliscomenobacter sp.]
MLSMLRTDAAHPDFIALVRLLDAELAERDGSEHDFYHQFNGIANIKHAVVCYEGSTPAGCGAIKAFSTDAMEVKRMFTRPDYRGKGVARAVLTELEHWAAELGFEKCVLETGKKQPEAIALYQKCGYAQTPNYGQYVGIENSLCFEKAVR